MYYWEVILTLYLCVDSGSTGWIELDTVHIKFAVAGNHTMKQTVNQGLKGEC